MRNNIRVRPRAAALFKRHGEGKIVGSVGLHEWSVIFDNGDSETFKSQQLVVVLRINHQLRVLPLLHRLRPLFFRVSHPLRRTKAVERELMTKNMMTKRRQRMLMTMKRTRSWSDTASVTVLPMQALVRPTMLCPRTFHPWLSKLSLNVVATIRL